MFDFNIYKGNSIYFRLFDAYFKETNTTKDMVFKELYINNGSYRRCREAEYKIGIEIIESLANYFNFKQHTDALVDQIKELAERVYNNMYYKIYDTYESDLKLINDLINDNCILFPILELLKLFLEVNSKKTPQDVLEQTKNDFERVKRYRLFFTKELNDILDILSLFYDKDIEDHKWGDTYVNPLSYQILAARASVKENHIGAIHYAEKAKEILIEDMNIKSIITINFTIINSLLYLGNYKRAYDLTLKQMMCVKTLNISGFDYDSTYRLMILTLLGMKEYDKIINELSSNDSLTQSDCICLLTALYYKDKSKYLEYVEDNKTYQLIIDLDNYLKTNDKKELIKLEKYKINKQVLNVLKDL